MNTVDVRRICPLNKKNYNNEYQKQYDQNMFILITTHNLLYVKSNVKFKVEYHCQFIPNITFVTIFMIFSSQLRWAFLFTFCPAFVFFRLSNYLSVNLSIFFLTFQGLLTFYTFLGMNYFKYTWHKAILYRGNTILKKNEGPQSLSREIF